VPVDGVDEPVQALAGVHVAAEGADPQLVVGGEVGQGEPVFLAVAGDVQLRAVQRGGVHLGAHEVDPARRARLAAREAHGHVGGERRFTRLAAAVGQVERDGVVGYLEQRGPRLRVGTGEVGRGHVEEYPSSVSAPDPTTRPPPRASGMRASAPELC
jgi:hypothetical protein